MKLSKTIIKQFEQDQKDHGTEVALFNFLWMKYSEDMKDLGVTRVRTENPK